MSFFDIMRWFLVVASLTSIITSILFLTLFSIPHSPDILEDETWHAWQKIGPNIISKLYDFNRSNHQEEDMRTELLMSVSSLVGSLGYDKATFYLTMSP